jgi:hypothetical protein
MGLSGFTQGFNRYGYCLNNPLRYTDPSGEILIPLLLLTDVGYDIQKFHFPVAVHIGAAYGNENKYLGYDISFGIPQISPISYRQHGGNYYYWKDYDNSYSGWEKRSGAEWSLFSGLFSYSDTYYDREGTKFDQYRNSVRIGSPILNLQVENDANGQDIFPFPFMPNHVASDKFLSGQVKLRFGMAELGLTLFTGEPDKEEVLYGDGYGPYGTYGLGITDPNEYRAGVLYLKVGPFKFGPNNEGIRDYFQNGLHDTKKIHTPRFLKLDRPNKWLWQIGW